MRDLPWTTIVGAIAYLVVVGVLSAAALLQSSHDALLALIAIAAPTGGAATIAVLHRPAPDASTTGVPAPRHDPEMSNLIYEGGQSRTTSAEQS